ncbi:hypothetical protein LSUE1_G009466 [Lachnellula suecica]|uniref:Uncharacterized protein n=1 Tax=Lachnellula suecica TaxID=602035 RepID=A0A8T9BVH7_9HELO|nr:hypothetical protein LSUE1_G009466 [Lachnellula suecica]
MKQVLQTTINYNNELIGGLQSTEVEGTYTTRASAYAAASTALLSDETTKESFTEYGERTAKAFAGERPHSEEYFVHAVAPTGENFVVEVKAQPHSHRLHACKHHGGANCDCKCKHTEEACAKKQKAIANANAALKYSRKSNIA